MNRKNVEQLTPLIQAYGLDHIRFHPTAQDVAREQEGAEQIQFMFPQSVCRNFFWVRADVNNLVQSLYHNDPVDEIMEYHVYLSQLPKM
jgi:hypothetical protein